MIIKKYKARSQQEAQSKIDQELGPEAIVLNTRQLKQGGIKGLFASEVIEVTVAIEEEELASFQATARKGAAATKSQVSPAKAHKKAANQLLEKEVKKAEAKDKSIATSSPSSNSSASLNENLSQLKDLMKNYSTPPAQSREIKGEGVHVVLSQAQANNQEGVESKERQDSFSLSSTTGTYSPFGKTQKPSSFSSLPTFESDKKEQGKQKAQEFIDMGKRLMQKVQVTPSPAFSEPFGNTTAKKPTPSPISSASPFSSTSNAPSKEQATSKNLASVAPSPAKQEGVAVGIDEIKNIIREEMRQAQYGLKKEVERQSHETHLDMSFLMSKGISRSIAWEVESAVNEHSKVEDFSQPTEERSKHINHLKDELASKVLVSGPLKLEKCRMVALLGSTGVGKTTTLAKLASLYNNVMGKKVAIINFDHDKFGPPPISHFAKQEQIPCFDVNSVQELESCHAKLGSFDLILIDTPGKNQFLKQGDLFGLQGLQSLEAVLGELSYYLVLSATTKDIDNYGCIKSTSSFPLEGLIFTKLDETISWGSLVNICQKTKKPLAYLSLGKKVPDDLILADSHKVAKQILLQHNQQSHTMLQRIANQ